MIHFLRDILRQPNELWRTTDFLLVQPVLGLPIPGVGRKTSGSQNIKSDVPWYAGLAEFKTGCSFAA
jgi:hypothetical protein